MKTKTVVDAVHNGFTRRGEIIPPKIITGNETSYPEILPFCAGECFYTGNQVKK